MQPDRSNARALRRRSTHRDRIGDDPITRDISIAVKCENAERDLIGISESTGRGASLACSYFNVQRSPDAEGISDALMSRPSRAGDLRVEQGADRLDGLLVELELSFEIVPSIG